MLSLTVGHSIGLTTELSRQKDVLISYCVFKGRILLSSGKSMLSSWKARFLAKFTMLHLFQLNVGNLHNFIMSEFIVSIKNNLHAITRRMRSFVYTWQYKYRCPFRGKRAKKINFISASN